MIVDEVRVVRSAPSGSSGSAARSLDLRVGNEVIRTPARCATEDELGMSTRHGLGATPGNVAVYARNIFYHEASNMLRNPYMANAHKNSLVRMAGSGVALALPSFQLGHMAGGTLNPMLHDTESQDEILDLLVKMQIGAHYGIVSIPHIGLNPDEQAKLTGTDVSQKITEDMVTPDWLEKKMRRLANLLDLCDRQPLFSIDMGYYAFDDLLNVLVKDFGQTVINLVYKSPQTAPAAYKSIRKHADKNVAFLVSEVKRTEHATGDMSSIHYAAHYGGDLFALETKLGFGYRERPNDTKRLMAFDRDTLGLRPVEESAISVDKIASDLGWPDSTRIIDVFGEIDDASHDYAKYDRINSLLRIHELCVSRAEMDALATSIREGKIQQYVASKGSLAKAFPVHAMTA